MYEMYAFTYVSTGPHSALKLMVCQMLVLSPPTSEPFAYFYNSIYF